MVTVTTAANKVTEQPNVDHQAMEVREDRRADPTESVVQEITRRR